MGRMAGKARHGNASTVDGSTGTTKKRAGKMGEVITTIARIDDLVIDESFNARKDYTEIERLAEDIKRHGQITPVMVRPLTGEESANRKNSGKLYFLIAGFRRVRALTKLEEETVKVQVHGVTPDEAATLNIVENIQREQLTVYEIAGAAAMLADRFKWSGPEIARKLGYSPAHVNNLLRCYRGLPGPILDAWRSEHELAKMTGGKYSLLSLTKTAAEEGEDAALAAWNEHCGIVEDGGDTDDDGGGNGVEKEEKAKRGPGRRKLEEMLTVMRKQGLKGQSDSFVKGVVAGLKLAVYGTTLPGWVEAEKKNKAKEEAGEADMPE